MLLDPVNTMGMKILLLGLLLLSLLLLLFSGLIAYGTITLIQPASCERLLPFSIVMTFFVSFLESFLVVESFLLLYRSCLHGVSVLMEHMGTSFNINNLQRHH